MHFMPLCFVVIPYKAVGTEGIRGARTPSVFWEKATNLIQTKAAIPRAPTNF